MANNEFKCPSCASPILFDSSLQKLKCHYCGTEIDVEGYKDYSELSKEPLVEDIRWKEQEAHYWQEGDPFEHYICESCGGEIIGEKTTVTTACPYCDNQVLITKNVQGILQPDYVIPFKLDKESAMEALKHHFQRKPLIPNIFKSQYKLEEIKGLYVPFWLFDGLAHGTIHFGGVKTRTWADLKYTYTSTSYYNILREGDVQFHKVPVDGSKMLDDTLMESLEPFDVSGLTKFHPGYLSGYLANKYDVPSEAVIDRVNDRIKKSVHRLFEGSIQGVSMLHTEKENLSVVNGQKLYALYPIWMMKGSFKNKEYIFAMNGQTGKIVGDIPVDDVKSLSYFGLIFLILTIIGLVFSYFWG